MSEGQAGIQVFFEPWNKSKTRGTESGNQTIVRSDVHYLLALYRNPKASCKYAKSSLKYVDVTLTKITVISQRRNIFLFFTPSC